MDCFCIQDSLENYGYISLTCISRYQRLKHYYFNISIKCVWTNPYSCPDNIFEMWNKAMSGEDNVIPENKQRGSIPFTGAHDGISLYHPCDPNEVCQNILSF